MVEGGCSGAQVGPLQVGSGCATLEARSERHHTEFPYGRVVGSVRLPAGANGGEATAQYRGGVLTVGVPVPESKTGTRAIPMHHVRHATAGSVAMPAEPGAPPMRADRPSRWEARGAKLKRVTKGAPCPSARVRPPGKADAVSYGGWLQDSPYWPATTARGCAATCWPE
ncbi:Hsp20/alpha crystallin family protein [Streptomyces sp. NPDC059697]|uniref:Hsp20/alpha crystallin family protein n=1 Tax=Streptomyces sp. NPDC059697 TaxID=3346912 RepID=UPI00368B7B63